MSSCHQVNVIMSSSKKNIFQKISPTPTQPQPHVIMSLSSCHHLNKIVLIKISLPQPNPNLCHHVIMSSSQCHHVIIKKKYFSKNFPYPNPTPTSCHYVIVIMSSSQ